MKTLLRQRVANYPLSPSHPFYPLFEAVANSLLAVEDRFGEEGSKHGTVQVTAIRTSSPHQTTLGNVPALQPIESFEITDNGIGFDDDHLAAFRVSDTDFRKAKGGKGIGRLSWLVAFKRATVDSVFAKPDGTLMRRRFTFTLDHVEGLDPETLLEEPVASSVPICTKIRLHSYNLDFQKGTKRATDALAHELVGHCLDYFALGNAPAMKLVDGATEVDLNDFFDGFESKVDQVTTPKGFALTVRHFLVKASGGANKHVLGLVAARRWVNDISLSEDNVFDLPGRLVLEGGGEGYVYVAYAHGDLLDKTVNDPRTGFNLPTGAVQDALFPTQRDVEVAVLEKAREYLAPHLKPLTEAKLKKVSTFVHSERPRWLHLLQNATDEIVKEVRPSMTNSEMDVALYRIDSAYRAKLAAQHAALLHQIVHSENGGQYREQMDALLDRLDEAHKAALVDYVVQRKVLIETITAGMNADGDGKFLPEADIHNHIMPMGLTSTDPEFEAKQNLWLINERLAFHHWVGSDKQIRMSPAGGNSSKEPDILSFIYGNPHLFSEGRHGDFASATVVEFKRPERDDYTDEENPILQVWKYIGLLRAGGKEDKNKRTLAAHTMGSIPYYGYTICTFTPRLEEMAQTLGFTKLPGREGYFHVHPNFNAYVEVLSFDEMLKGARHRNRIFFERLGLPSL